MIFVYDIVDGFELYLENKKYKKYTPKIQEDTQKPAEKEKPEEPEQKDEPEPEDHPEELDENSEPIKRAGKSVKKWIEDHPDEHRRYERKIAEILS